VDFGYARLQPAGISGRVVNDLDGDGQLEDGEPGLAGWGLCLTPGSSDVISCRMVHTDSNGVYTLKNLWPGEYDLRPDPSESGEEQGQLSDWVVTTPDGAWRTITLEEGQQVTGVDFGISTRSSSGRGPSSPPVSGRALSPPVSSSDSSIESWQIAVAAIGSAAALGGALGAVLIVRRRRARSG